MTKSSLIIVILFTVCISSCRQKSEQKNELLYISTKENKTNKLHRFYDFNISVYVYRSTCSDTNDCRLHSTKYVLCNSDEVWDEDTRQYDKLKGNILYMIVNRYYLKSSVLSKKDIYQTDTLKVKLTKEQIDKLYKFTHVFFELDNIQNVSTDSIPPPPSLYDGPNARVVLDQGFRGNHYSVVIGIPERDKNYVRIKEYVDKLLATEIKKMNIKQRL